MGCSTQTKTKEIKVYELKRYTITKNGNFFFSDRLTKKADINKFYKLKQEYLGKGSSGIVCEATNSRGQIFAVKRVNKTQIKNYINMTEEVEISKIVNNKNIIKTYEIFEDEKTISFVMELIEGGDLFEFILKSPNQKLSDKQTIDFLIQILETISYLHNDLNVCHRDLKPENFLIETNDNIKPIIKLIDFGFACHIPSNGYMEQYFGTPIYTAPEIIQNWSYSEKIDLWSVGVILFNMTTGCQPFSTDEDDINKEVLEKDIQFDVIDNENIRNLCMKLLEKYPAARIDAKKALEEAIEIRDNL
jgi:serine/threonine protein kinase